MTEKRISAIRNILSENEAALITSDINRRYFTGFNSSAGTVVITKNSAFLLIDFRYFEKAKNMVKNLTVILAKRLFSQLEEIFKRENIKNILIETDTVTISYLNRLKSAFKDLNIDTGTLLSDKIKNLRSIKDKEEISLIKKAQSITDKAFEHILNFINLGKTEKEIALELEVFMRKNGSEGVAFNTIAISGKNTSMPHGVPTDKPLEKGDFITMDYGASFGGYCSDMTRTVALEYITEEQNFVYNTVLKAQKSALESIKVGKICKDIDAVARDLINNAGFENCFGHGLGHSVGLEIHENPSFNTRDESVLKEGMLITVEPGIYLEDRFGVRIEDMVIITETGFENITKSPKNLIIL